MLADFVALKMVVLNGSGRIYSN